MPYVEADCANHAGEGFVARYDPGVALRNAELLAEILKQSRRGGREFAPIVHALPISREDAGDGIEVRGDAFVAGIRIEKGFREKILREMRNVFEALRRKGFGVAYAAKNDQDDALTGAT